MCRLISNMHWAIVINKMWANTQIAYQRINKDLPINYFTFNKFNFF